MPPRILFSQLPQGHVALVVVDRVQDEDIAEVYLRLGSVESQGEEPAKAPTTPTPRRVRAQACGALDPRTLARLGTDVANGEIGGHDPWAPAPFPVHQDPLHYGVLSLRPALAVGRDFLDLVASETQIPGVRELAQRITTSSEPLLYRETLVESIGVESNLVSLLQYSGGVGVRAQLRLIEPQPAGVMAGEGLAVSVSARAYDHLTPAGLPSAPVAEGREVRATARRDEWTTLDLELPPVPPQPSGYWVVAKVFSADSRYPQAFEPSRCFARNLQYGS